MGATGSSDPIKDIAATVDLDLSDVAAKHHVAGKGFDGHVYGLIVDLGSAQRKMG